MEQMLKEIIKNAIMEALQELNINSKVSEDVKEVKQPKKEEEKKETEKKEEVEKKEIIEEEKKEEVESVKDEEVIEMTEEGLNKMPYNKLKSLASDMGLDAKGTKKVLVKRILENNIEIGEEIETPDVKEEVKKVTKKEEKPVVVKKKEEEEEEISEDKKEIIEALNQLSVDELKENLEAVGKATTGGKQALVARLLKAHEEGLISFGEDDSEEEVEEEKNDEIEIDLDRIESKIDNSNKTRATTQKKIMEQVLKDIAEGKITDKDMKKIVDSETLVEDYTILQMQLVDEDGELNEMSSPYYVGEDIYCCGEAIKQLDGSTACCEVCGQEYELE